MCGIAGVLRQDGGLVDPRLVRRMTEVLAHRGPDGDGFHVAGSVGLGHRRLAIIDLVSGSQPMGTPDGATWITYNGEVYNYAALRRELKERGHRFRTDSDTEVVLSAYEEWGVDCVTRLRGMFAFGIWDGRRRRIFLARDRVGIKPLVYAWDGGSLRFASEIKALLEDPDVARELDWDALRDYLIHHYIPAPRTIFQGIRKLPPASYLLCSADGGEPIVEKYWDLQFVPEHGRSEADWTEEIGEVLREATRLHMISDVPVGAFLSGGVDSSSVVACMAKVSNAPVKTFSIGFDESDYDELKYARVVAARYGTEHFELVIKPDVMNILPRLAWQFDEPFGDASAVPSYCVAKITREHVTVALSGDGGDESFAGYRRYAWALNLHRRMDLTPLCVLKPLLRWTEARRSAGARGREFLGVLGMAPLDRYARIVSYQSAETLGWLLRPEALERMTPPTLGEECARLAAASGSRDYLSQLQYIDIHHYLPDDILSKVDRTSMLASLETRVPLLDHVVMEHAARIPSSLKLGATGGKHVFRAAMRPYLSEDILDRRKMGFGVPLAGWFRGTLREFAHDLLLDGRARQRGMVDAKAVAGMLAERVGGGSGPFCTVVGLDLPGALVPDVAGSMTTRPVVAHVIHSLAVGGLENGVVNLVNDANHEFRHVIVCMSKGGPMRSRVDSGVEVVEVGKRPGNDVRALVRLVRTFRQFRPAIVHSRNWAAFDAVLAARVAGVRRVVHSEHGREFGDPEGRNGHKKRVRRALSPLVTRFITVSRELQRWLTDDVGIRTEKVSTIHNGVDLSRFCPMDRGEARTRIGLPRHGRVIGTVGRLDPVKDQASLIHAFAKLRPGHPDTRLLIVGDGPYREELTRLVREYGMEDQVLLAGERQDIPVALAAMDVFALPSIAEGMSNTLLEAMASGLPAVATRVGGTVELLEDGKTGRLIERGDRAALEKVLSEYLEDAELRLTHGRAAREWVAEHFGLERMCREYFDVYRGVLAGRCGKAV